MTLLVKAAICNKLKIFISLILILSGELLSGQVKVRIFANRKPEYAVCSVSEGRYKLDAFNGDSIFLEKGEMAVIAGLNGRLAVRLRNKKGFIADSLMIKGLTGSDSFSLLVNDGKPIRQYYSGDLFCTPDLGTILLINIQGIEDYIAGVVRAEGGIGRNIEYFKSQAVIARTYMYKYLNKHIQDGYNLCDDTHCQAFNGVCTDPIIIEAASETYGIVILDRDSTLVISAFHSNCGGETADAADVWLTSVPYLKSVKDPYCTGSRNSSWQKTFTAPEWQAMVSRTSHSDRIINIADAGFTQQSRTADYNAASFRIPLRDIRTDLNLRSTFFSVYPQGDSIVLKGKGYGHGVGLCQEGAMVMAERGFDYSRIIRFYYSGVTITGIGNAKPDMSPQ